MVTCQLDLRRSIQDQVTLYNDQLGLIRVGNFLTSWTGISYFYLEEGGSRFLWTIINNL
jgi:hypothetical protein